jgi:transposase-like protein
MTRYSNPFDAEIRRRVRPPQKPSETRISEELRILVVTLYNWWKAWRQQGTVVFASEKETKAEAPQTSSLVLETTSLNTAELSVFCHELGLFPEQVYRWRRDSQDVNAQTLLTMSDQMELQKRQKEDQREIKQLQQELRHKEKAHAEAAALQLAAKKMQAF